MQKVDTTQVTQLLDRIGKGDSGASDQLLDLVYDQLRVVADRMFVADGGHTLQPTAIVHEAWMKMAGDLGRYENRRHFFAVAATAMRHVLADHARAESRQKRGGPARTLTLDRDPSAATAPEVDLSDLHESLETLAELNPRHARIVELRLFGALTLQEVADTLSVSVATVHADWKMARAWLQLALGPQ